MHNASTSDQVFNLKHRAVRDLYWSLWGPELFIHPAPYSQQPQHFPIDWQWLQQQDQQPGLLINFLATKNTRLLGTYFEALWHFYFLYHPSIRRNTTNLQVDNGKRTIGEFDALLITEGRQTFHIELACKFYLQWQGTLWIGPNCSDRLDIKFDRTQAHQLPLLQTELGSSAVQKNLDLTSIDQIQQLGIWRGQAFYSEQWFRDMYITDIPQANDSDLLWFIADKTYWLSPVVIEDSKQLSSFADISLKIHQHFLDQAPKQPHTLMLITLNFHKQTNQWRQCHRYFITANNWPYGNLSDSALTPLRPCSPPL